MERLSFDEFRNFLRSVHEARFILLASVGGIPCAIPPYLLAVRLKSADRVEHDDRDLAFGFLLVVGVGRPEF